MSQWSTLPALPTWTKPQKQLAVAEHAAQLKIKKYKEMAVENQAEFVHICNRGLRRPLYCCQKTDPSNFSFRVRPFVQLVKKRNRRLYTLCGWGCCAKRQLFGYDRWLSRLCYVLI